MSRLNWDKSKREQAWREAKRSGHAIDVCAPEPRARAARAEVTYRIWLNVPYAEKDQAKKAGCRWDPQVRRWYAPLAIPLERIERWRR